MGIPGLASFVWANRYKISSHFVCNSNNTTYTLECIPNNDDDCKEQKDEFTVTKTIFNRQREYIVFDAYSITAQFFSSKRHPFMDFYRIKSKLNDFIDCWLQCGFKLIFVFDGYASWLNDTKQDETLRRVASRYRDIKKMNQHLHKFHEYYSKNIIKSRYDNYITDTDIKSDDSETTNEQKTDTNPTDINWTYNVNDCLYAGYSTYIINIFYCLCESKQNVQIWHTKSEADQQIATWVNNNKDKVFGICSSDTDFYVFNYTNIWIINAASIKYKKSNKYLRIYKSNKNSNKKTNLNLHNYINDKNNNIYYPCVSFVATKPDNLWKYLGLGDTYEQRLFYTQIVGMDIIDKKKPQNFVKEFELENKIKDVNNKTQIAFAIANIVQKYYLNKENKINDKIKEFYTLNQPLDLCSNRPSKDELLLEGYTINKHMFECVKNCVNPIFNALKPIRMMMYKRYINKVKNNKVKEYILSYNNDQDKIDLKINEIEIDKQLNEYVCLQHPYFINNIVNWTWENMLLLLIQTNKYLNEFGILNNYKNKGNAMILQLKYRRIYTSNTYSINEDNNNNIDQNWDIKNAVKCYRYFSRHCMPKPIDLYVQSLFMKCIEYICWDIKIPPIDILLCGPLFHFMCQYQENDKNNVLPILTDFKQ
eukprot:130610_1